jgi:FlaG/FlaF family flagellin (archaellin)
MRWIVFGAVLMVAIVVALAVWIGTNGRDHRRPPRLRQAAPQPALVVGDVR